MKNGSGLYVDYCSHEASLFACEHWHYSGKIPAGKKVKYGAWENGDFIGTLIYTNGASPWLSEPFDGITRTDVSELARVALGPHECPTSKVIAVSLRLIAKHSPGLKVVISFADPKAGHDGTVYQASNWLYLGRAESAQDIIFGKRRVHERTVGNKWGTTSIKELREMLDIRPIYRVDRPPKFKYAYPLDDDFREQIQPLVKPYPSGDEIQAPEA